MPRLLGMCWLFCVVWSCMPQAEQQASGSAYVQQLDSLQQRLQTSSQSVQQQLAWAEKTDQSQMTAKDYDWEDVFYFFKEADVTGPRMEGRYKVKKEQVGEDSSLIYLALDQDQPVQKLIVLRDKVGRTKAIYAYHLKDSPFYASKIIADGLFGEHWRISLSVVQIHRITGKKETLNCLWTLPAP